MKDGEKTKDQLNKQLVRLHQRIAELEEAESIRKRAEGALRESEAKYRRIVDTANEGIWSLDENFVTTFVNKRMVEMIGYDESEMIGRPVDWFMFEEDLPNLREKMHDRRTGISDRYERRYRHKDGSTVWVLLSVTPLVEDESFKGSFAMVTDITERKLMEERLRLSEGKYRSLVETTSDCIWEIDPQGRYNYLSPKFEDLTGYPPEEFLGRTPYDLLPADEAHRVREQVSSRIALQQPISSVEAQFRHRDGRLITVEVSSIPIFNPKGEYRGMRGITRDITRRKRAEEALRKSEERFRVAQESSLDAFTILEAVRNENGKIVDFHWAYVNPEAGRILRYPAEELVGKRLLKLLPGNKNDSDLFDHYVQVVETGEPQDYELFYDSEGIRGWFRNMTVKLGDGVAVHFGDITERKRVEQALRESEAKFRTLVERMPYGVTYIHALDDDRTLIYVSPQVEKILGYPAQELIRDPRVWHECVHPDDYERVVTQVIQCEKTGQTVATEYRVFRKDRQLVWMHDVFTLMFDENGRPTSLLGVAFDITRRKQMEDQLRESHLRLESRVRERTAELAANNEALVAEIAERKRAEKALKSSEQQYRELAENIREVFWVGTPDQILYISPAYEEIWGRNRDSLLKAPDSLIETLHPEDRGRFLEAQNAIRRKGDSLDLEYRIIRPDGALRWIWGRSFPVMENGRLVRIVGIAEDITARKEAEEFLRIETDLAMQLASAVNLTDALELLLDACLKTEGLDCGGIYVVERETGALRLICHRGLSEEFVKGVFFFEPTSWQGRFAMQGKPAYWSNLAEMPGIGSLFKKEGLEVLASIPVKSESEVVAVLNIASHTGGDISFHIRSFLEILASRIGGIIARIRLGETIKVQSEHQEETNAALRVLLKQRELDRSELEESLMSNVKSLVLPYLDKLKKSRLGEEQKHLFEILDAHLREITSPFVRKLSAPMLKLTPTEIRVAELVHQGLSTKEIADLLTTSESAVIFHRQGVRRKLGLIGRGINLQTYLATLL